MANKHEKEIGIIIRRLKRRYGGEMHTTLSHSSPWELLVATILSAQSQDAQVNKVTPKLFRAYKTIADFARAKPSSLYPYVKTLGLYRSKSRNIVAAAKHIQNRLGGRMPRTIEGMLELPGVGRKTANVVLSNAFNSNAGIAIDTHCITVSNRLFLYHTRNPEKIEKRLMTIVPRKDWGNLTHLFIALGRDVCTAKEKRCERCVLNGLCPSSTVKR
ncbi:MAG: endonuclease III [Candidatus Marsarchaeota archaeon]|nr:endonuclease III [Candidatus Marsarchaeota archaeon]